MAIHTTWILLVHFFRLQALGKETPIQYVCLNSSGKEIPASKFCDGVDDCNHGRSDEIVYNKTQHSQAGIPCLGKKINKYCLLTIDQADKEAEICRKDPPARFLCSNSQAQIRPVEFCNGVIDCNNDDSDDEIEYDKFAHKEIGVPCLSKTRKKKFCLIKNEQAHKKITLCGKLRCKNKFVCSDGLRCIAKFEFCDGVPHCFDNSDEIPFQEFPNINITPGMRCRARKGKRKCLLPNAMAGIRSGICQPDVVCNADEFMCEDGVSCIKKEWLCDSVIDCLDGSDEFEINATISWPVGRIPCRSWKYLQHFCFLPSSTAGREEEFCNTNAVCKPNFFKCLDSSACIDAKWFCDGVEDCSDGSDETQFIPGIHDHFYGIPCTTSITRKKTCLLPSSEVEKHIRICVKGHLQQNLYNDSSSFFLCADESGWIPGLLFCDGHSDCKDGTDEIKYISLQHESKGVSCRHWTKLKNICFLPSNQSSKREKLCNPGRCQKNQFECSDGSECIPKQKFCNGVKDCRDASDEMQYKFANQSFKGIACQSWSDLQRVCLLSFNQSQKENQLCNSGDLCPRNHFKCADGTRCVRSGEFCDCVPQCRDWSDEIEYKISNKSIMNGAECGNKFALNKSCFLPLEYKNNKSYFCNDEKQCDKGYFRCKDHSFCLWKGRFCDGNVDCGDGSDEVTFDTLRHTDQDGIPCQSLAKTNRFCLLPEKEKWKKKYLCKPEKECTNLKYKCRNGQGCILRYRFCDGKKDCSDGSDEIRAETYHNATIDGISCLGEYSRINQNLTCLLPTERVCDGQEDCIDGSDECFCDPNQQHGRFKQVYSDEKCFRCLDGSKTIPTAQLCDGIIQCKDLSDECLCESSSKRKQLKICHQLNVMSQCAGQISCSMNNATVCVAKEKICDLK